jgi:hypothetical protein
MIADDLELARQATPILSRSWKCTSPTGFAPSTTINAEML